MPLKLLLEMHECKDEMLGNRLLVFRGMCSVKVFKDKGGDRKQRQDQVKMEKLTPAERVSYCGTGWVEVMVGFVVEGAVKTGVAELC